MNTTLQFFTAFSQEETDLLWGQGVCMDDWDYAIVCDPDILEEEEYEEVESKWVYFDHIAEVDRHWDRIDHGDGSYSMAIPWEKGGYMDVSTTKKRYTCKEYSIDRLLTGCCSNTWYLIQWNGEKKAIGVAYHA